MPDHSAIVEPGRDDRTKLERHDGRWRRWLFALLIVAALALAAMHFGDLEKFVELLKSARPAWLVGALALQLLTYVLLAAEWSLVLRSGGTPTSIVGLLPLTITKLFADQVVPTAGMSGNVLIVDRLAARGMPREQAVAAVILAIIAYYLSYSVCAVAAVVLLWLRGGASMLVTGIVGLFLAVAVAIPAATMWLQNKGEGVLPGWLRRREIIRELFEMVGEAPSELVRSPRLIIQLSLLNLGVFVADAVTMQLCLLAIGQQPGWDAAFVAFIMASIIVTLGPIPLGLGSFEAVSIGMLRLMGVPFEPALSATLLFRGFVLWLPLIAGTALSRRELRKR